jgi:hypothetical protein
MSKLKHSIDNLLDINKELERNSQLLQEEINGLQTASPKPAEPDKRDALIKLIAPDIERNEKLMGRGQRMQEIGALYRELYPEGVG